MYSRGCNHSEARTAQASSCSLTLVKDDAGYGVGGGGGGAVVDVIFLLLILSCRKIVLPIVGKVPDVEIGT